MKKAGFWFAFYLGMMFVTNSYCQVYRWSEWAKPNKYEHESYVADERAHIRTGFATVFWPAYWISRGSIFILEQTKRIKIDVKASATSTEPNEVKP